MGLDIEPWRYGLSLPTEEKRTDSGDVLKQRDMVRKHFLNPLFEIVGKKTVRRTLQPYIDRVHKFIVLGK